MFMAGNNFFKSPKKSDKDLADKQAFDDILKAAIKHKLKTDGTMKVDDIDSFDDPLNKNESVINSYTDINLILDTILEAVEDGELDETDDIIDSSIDDSMNMVNDSNDDGVDVPPAEDTTQPVSDNDLVNELNQIFNPVLIMQSINSDIEERIAESTNVLLERNVIKFDDETRMAQLISVCAILLQRKKNTQKYQAYKNAIAIVNQTKLDMQKEEYAAAKALAQKYLINVSTTNNSSIARKAANNLLPETQH